MADIAVFASGNGSNFQAIAERLRHGPHAIRYLVCDKPGAYVLERAEHEGITSHVIPYRKGNREESENAISRILLKQPVDLIVLAGFMRILSPRFIDSFPGSIINIHPSLLPKYPGTNGIELTYHSNDRYAGVTIHYVDHGVDTGSIICQEKIDRLPGETLSELESRIHALEHKLYPDIIMKLLAEIDSN